MHPLTHRTTLLLLATGIACGGGHDSTSPTALGITGTWTLQTVNGAPLPFTIRLNDTTAAEVSASYDLKATGPSGGSFSYTETDRVTVGGSAVTLPQRYPVTGIFTLNTTSVNDTIVSFQDAGFAGLDIYRASWSGNTLTFRFTVPIEDGQVYVFVRQ